MKIGIIGAGSIGYNLAKKLAPNHDIKLAASKLTDELKAKADSIAVKAVNIRHAVKDVEVIIFSIPFKAIAYLPKDLLEGVSKDVIIADTANYIPFRDGNIEELDQGKVETVWVCERLGRPVIKAFNNFLTETLINEGRPKADPDRIAVSVAGDSQEGKEIISALINEIGFDVVDTGDLSESWRQQPGTPAYCTELNNVELKEALAAADREKAPINRDELINRFAKTNFSQSKDETVAACRSVYGDFRKTKNDLKSLSNEQKI